MPEEDGSTKTETEPPKETVREVHVGLKEEDIEKHIRKLRDEMTELHSGDKAEREALKLEIAELQEHKKKLEEAEANRDKVESSTSTMVLPPTDIPPQQPSPPPNDGTTHPGEPKKRLRWW